VPDFGEVVWLTQVNGWSRDSGVGYDVQSVRKGSQSACMPSWSGSILHAYMSWFIEIFMASSVKVEDPVSNMPTLAKKGESWDRVVAGDELLRVNC
jgi:hypothetical protein